LPLADDAEHANAEVLTFAMIETRRAIDHLDEIASVPGRDGLFVGPGDLYLSLTGRVGMDVEDAQMDSAYQHILAACRAYALIPGIFAGSASLARRYAALGFRFITVQSDTALLLEAARSSIRAARSTE
jgi:4-hydroxy-2-oxoheptanedioate aldolase